MSASTVPGDPGGMLAAVGTLGSDCRSGYAVGLAVADLPRVEGVTSVALCGMGGSAVGGDVVRALYLGRLGVPIEVVRSPLLPEFCGPHTLVVCTSYSGNTAETLAAFEEADRRGCRLVAITSGGEIAARAATSGVPALIVPSGMQPRAALGWLAMGLLGVLEAIGMIPSLKGELEESVTLLERISGELSTEGGRARALAARIGDRTPVIWGADGIGSVAAMRWKTQMNENGKVPAWWSTMSELDHNEVAAWTGGSGERFFLVALRHAGEHPSIAPRFPLSIAIARDAGIEAEEVWAEGTSPLARFLSLVAVGDFTSVYVALGRGVDPTPVATIERLKRELAGG